VQAGTTAWQGRMLRPESLTSCFYANAHRRLDLRGVHFPRSREANMTNVESNFLLISHVLCSQLNDVAR
jgi:hypothetical protein